LHHLILISLQIAGKVERKLLLPSNADIEHGTSTYVDQKKEGQEKVDADALQWQEKIPEVHKLYVSNIAAVCPKTKNVRKFFGSFRRIHDELSEEQVSTFLFAGLFFIAQTFLFFPSYVCLSWY
jgi:hypothetical protein